MTVLALLALIAAAAILGSWVLKLHRDRGLTQPLGSIAGLYGRALVLYVVAAAFWLSRGFGGGGRRASVCVNTAFPYSGSAGPGHAANAGASVSVGNIQACALHPSGTQWLLYLLTKAPDIILWGILLLLIWQLISHASRGGPFTDRVAGTIQQLGLVLIGGSMIAGALEALGTDLLTRMLMTPATFSGGGIVVDVLAGGALKALLPVPAIAGAALLSFARITRVAAVLDEEVKATV